MGFPLPEEATEDRSLPRDVLVTPAQLAAAGYFTVSQAKAEAALEAALAEGRAATVCVHKNEP